MIRKIILISSVILLGCNYSVDAMGKGSVRCISVFKADTTQWFPSCDIYEEFLGVTPVASLNYMLVIAQKRLFFFNLGFAHSIWIHHSASFFHTTLTSGVKISRFIKLYGGMILKGSSDNIRLKQHNAFDLFGTLGLEIDISKTFFVKLNYYKHLYDFTPNIYENYNLFFPFTNIKQTPYLPYGLGIGYKINAGKLRTKQAPVQQQSLIPKNIFYLNGQLQYPFWGVGFERMLFNKDKYRLSIDISYRQGKYFNYYRSNSIYFIGIESKFEHKIKNTQVSLSNYIRISRRIYLNSELVAGYYYVVDDKKPSYFNDFGIKSGLVFFVGNHFQMKYQFYYPLIYFNIRPKQRAYYYYRRIGEGENSSYPVISIGYVF